MVSSVIQRGALVAIVMLLCTDSGAVPPQSASSDATAREPVVAKPKLDRSGKPRKGKASYYAQQFNRKKMANGKPFNPHQDIAASKTLPLGTVAKVTNLDTGKSDVVTVEDRGPYVKGRIVDVSPKAAAKIGLDKEGVAPVEVKPLVLPKPDAQQKAAASSPKS